MLVKPSTSWTQEPLSLEGRGRGHIGIPGILGLEDWEFDEKTRAIPGNVRQR